MGVANAVDLPRDDLVAALEVYCEDLVAQVEGVIAVRDEQNQGGVPLLVESLFDYAVSMSQAERAWVEQLIVKLRPES